MHLHRTSGLHLSLPVLVLNYAAFVRGFSAEGNILNSIVDLTGIEMQWACILS